MNKIESITRSGSMTENGTPIVMPGQESDKDLFMKMLVAQMSNQDPFNPQDPTQYVTQLAQFSMLEQIMDLGKQVDYLSGINNGILVNQAVSTASSLIGKGAEFDSVVDDKIVTFEGTVKSAFIKDGQVYLEVQLKDSSDIKEFKYEELVKVK